MAIICDGKHDEPMPARSGHRISGEIEIDGMRAEIDFGIRIKGKQFCDECFTAILPKIDLNRVAEAMKKAQAERDARKG